MAGHKTYEQSKKDVIKGLILLGIVTLVEVFISLLGKGHIIAGAEKYSVVIYSAGILIIVLSLYKAYFIVYEFMHMAYEVKGLAMSVLLPTLLLIWAIIAFFQEGNSWKERRQQIDEFNQIDDPNKAIDELQGDVLPEDVYLPKDLG